METEMKINLCREGFGILLNSIDVGQREINLSNILNHIVQCNECKQYFNEFIKKIELPLPAKMMLNNIITTK